MIRTFLPVALLSLTAAPANAETVQLRAGHLIDPGSGKVTGDRLPTLAEDGGVCVAGVIQAGRLVHRDDGDVRCDRWKRP